MEEIKTNKEMLDKADLRKFGIPLDVKIKINDNLPPNYQTILYFCRVLWRDGKIEKVESEGGEVKIKLLNGEAWHIIRHKQMLIDLFPDVEFK